MALPLRYSIGNLRVRRGRTGLTVGVIALVVLATTLFSSVVTSLRRTLASTGSERNLIVMRKGATNDGSSSVTLEALQAIRFFEGVARDARDRPLVSPELVVQPFFERTDGGRENVLVRGVEEVALQVHDEVEIAEGRMLRPSSGEAVLGRQVEGRYAGAELGGTLRFGHRDWRVVGVLHSGGSSFESEVWVDPRELAESSRRPQSYSGFRLRVAPDADLDELARRIADDPRFALEAERETDYYADQAENANALYVLVVGLALLAGVGAAFGAANTLYASVQARVAEIGTLRALGFPRRAILGSFLVEAAALGGAGFALGAALAWVAGRVVSALLGGVGFGAVTFTTSIVRVEVGGFDLLLSAVLAGGVGLVGGLLPALRAARLRPVEALRRA